MKRRNHGFTLVELMLAMTFVSGLLLAIALLTIQVVNVYSKGVTMSAVSQAGQSIVRELKEQVGSAPRGNILVVEKEHGGRICTGKLSYVWNYGDAINDTSGTLTVNKYTDGSHDLRFVKIDDPGGALCATDNLTPNIDKTKALELLESSDRNLALKSLTFSPYVLSESAQTIYAAQAIVGTNNQGELITGQTECKPPSEGYNEFCAVNIFEFTIRVGNNDTGSA